MRLSYIKAADYDAVFYPGGHGPMWDLAEDPHSIALIEAFYSSDKPVAAVCHAPGVLHRVQFQGQPLVKGKRVTGFTNGEEEAVHLTKVVPFLVEDELKRLGGLYEKVANWAIRRHRRQARHRPEPGLVQSGGRGAAETSGMSSGGGSLASEAFAHLQSGKGCQRIVLVATSEATEVQSADRSTKLCLTDGVACHPATTGVPTHDRQNERRSP